jgi:transposase InsO family protein
MNSPAYSRNKGGRKRPVLPCPRARSAVDGVTYLPTDEGFLYLAFNLDACSRKVVGWSLWQAICVVNW